ncbi:MAG: hypothetical protein KGD58_11005 [Candidatus Lokiarchaeota archaeon]|nr:hypothetical protein [Candidatus Lokiarchaeota archaeon]
MTTKKYLSNKKTTQQTISISPSLKEWINRYVNINYRKDPNDERFKSISAFYNHVLENVMELFGKGKSLDDFKRVEDKGVKDFFEQFTFNATVPLYEMVSENNRYSEISFNRFTRFLLSYLNFLRKNFRKNNYEDLKILFERIKSRVNPSPISKDMSLEIFSDRRQNYTTGILEFVGKQRNLHFENCKFFAAILGILGVKLTDFIYSPKDYYCRIDFIETDLLFREGLARKERIELLKENVDFIINYNRILDDSDDKHLWMKLAEDNMLFINFKSKNTYNKWLKTVENDLQKYGQRDDFLGKILLFFEKIHWIRLHSGEKDYSFQLEPVLESDDIQRKWLIDSLSKYAKISQTDGTYYLKNTMVGTYDQ